MGDRRAALLLRSVNQLAFLVLNMEDHAGDRE